MGAGDALLARYQAEIEERSKFIDGVVEAAEKDGRDLTEQEMTLLARTRDRIGELNEQVAPLQSTIEIATSSRKRTAEIAQQFEKARNPDAAKPFEYRSAGEYILDYWKAGLGSSEPAERLELFNRAAAHQTTGDNPGLLPQQMIEPVISFIDASRPLVSAFGARNLPAGTWNRPKISQHVTVAPQTAEKTELVSRKMIIGMVPVTATTYGGYVNVSRQNIDWSQPAVMDLVINDLANVYAQETETAFCAALDAATTAGPALPTGVNTPDQVAAAIWAAVGTVYAGVKGAGRTIVAVSPDMLGLVGPLFPPVNPTNAQGSGFNAASFGSGAQGSISGLSVVCSYGFDAGTMIVANTAAAEVYEDRIGSLQVVEPSVLGVQVAYAGYFADLIIEPEGIVEITKTP
jgi:HK97 family phage major capsid protein